MTTNDRPFIPDSPEESGADKQENAAPQFHQRDPGGQGALYAMEGTSGDYSSSAGSAPSATDGAGNDYSQYPTMNPIGSAGQGSQENAPFGFETPQFSQQQGQAGPYQQGSYPQGINPQGSYPAYSEYYTTGQIPYPSHGGFQTGPEYASQPTGGYAPVPAGGAGTPLTPIAPVQPMDPKRKKQLIAVGIALVVVLFVIIGAVVALSIANATRSPEAAVRQYLTYIANGEASKATEMVDPGVTNDSRIFMTDDVLKSASERITIHDVKEKDTQSGSQPVSKRVEATISLEGQRFTRTFNLSPGKKEFGVLNTWNIENSLVSAISVRTVDLPGYSIGGVERTVKDIENSREEIGASQYIYPGVYSIEPMTTEYYTAESQTLKVLPEETFQADLVVRGEPTEVVKEAALKAAVDYVNSCGSVEGNLNENCPYQVRNKNLARLEVTTLPSSVVKIDEYGFSTDEAVITIRRNPERFSPNPPDEEIKFYVTGSFESDDEGKPTFSLTYSFIF